ncbi:hypothetical protein FACS189499_03860 [Clostridia bacterium]|nr:hypothetical protein FACS189499_03860 [Clostridia bacterium]
MNTHELQQLAREYREYKRIAEEAAATMDGIADKIKAVLGDTEKVIAGEYKITYSPVTSNRIDTSALKSALPDIAAQFSKTTTIRRFIVS